MVITNALTPLQEYEQAALVLIVSEIQKNRTHVLIPIELASLSYEELAGISVLLADGKARYSRPAYGFCFLVLTPKGVKSIKDFLLNAECPIRVLDGGG